MKIERIIFGVIIALSMGVYAYAESCSSVGSTQYKHTASGCSYTTSTRTCCSDGTWSDWDKECCTGAGCCTSGTCWNGSTCETQISSKCGDQANMVYSNCVQGKGYLYYCVCKSDGTTKQVYKNDSFSCPDLSCYSGTNAYGVKTITISLNDNCYAAHTGGGNTGSIGVCFCGMYGYKTPKDCGCFPITKVQFEAGMKFVAELCIKYKLEVSPITVFTHYEFGQLNPKTSSFGKIDITYLPPYAWVAKNDIGNFIRSKVRWYKESLKG